VFEKDVFFSFSISIHSIVLVVVLIYHHGSSRKNDGRARRENRTSVRPDLSTRRDRRVRGSENSRRIQEREMRRAQRVDGVWCAFRAEGVRSGTFFFFFFLFFSTVVFTVVAENT